MNNYKEYIIYIKLKRITNKHTVATFCKLIKKQESKEMMVNFKNTEC